VEFDSLEALCVAHLKEESVEFWTNAGIIALGVGVVYLLLYLLAPDMDL
jgi:hypothetical protein